MQMLLTFVAVRLFLPKGATRLPRPVANALYQIVAMVAQQFEGYIFTVNIDEVRTSLRTAQPSASPEKTQRLQLLCSEAPPSANYKLLLAAAACCDNKTDK